MDRVRERIAGKVHAYALRREKERVFVHELGDWPEVYRVVNGGYYVLKAPHIRPKQGDLARKYARWAGIAGFIASLFGSYNINRLLPRRYYGHDDYNINYIAHTQLAHTWLEQLIPAAFNNYNLYRVIGGVMSGAAAATVVWLLAWWGMSGRLTVIFSAGRIVWAGRNLAGDKSIFAVVVPHRLARAAERWTRNWQMLSPGKKPPPPTYEIASEVVAQTGFQGREWHQMAEFANDEDGGQARLLQTAIQFVALREAEETRRNTARRRAGAGAALGSSRHEPDHE